MSFTSFSFLRSTFWKDQSAILRLDKISELLPFSLFRVKILTIQNDSNTSFAPTGNGRSVYRSYRWDGHQHFILQSARAWAWLWQCPLASKQDQYKSPCQQHRVFQSSLTSMRSAGTELLNLSFWTALVYSTWHSCWYQTLFTHHDLLFLSKHSCYHAEWRDSGDEIVS